MSPFMTAPRWQRCDKRVWLLSSGERPWLYFGPDDDESAPQTGIPALAAISLDDPNADVLALIAVVRHLAGVARG